MTSVIVEVTEGHCTILMIKETNNASAMRARGLLEFGIPVTSASGGGIYHTSSHCTPGHQGNS